LGFLAYTPFTAAQSPVTLTPETTAIDLVPHVVWAYAPERNWQLSRARDYDYQPLVNARFGHRDEVIWLKTRLHNQSAQALSLVFDSGYMHNEEVRYFIVDADNKKLLDAGVLGIAYPLRERAIPTIDIVFPLTLTAGQQVEIYLAYSSRFMIDLHPAIYSVSQFYQQESAHKNLSIGLYGIVVGLVIYSMMFVAYVKEPKYGLFVFFMLAWVGQMMATDGFIYLFWPYQWLGAYPPQFFYVLVGVSVIAMSTFCLSYLNLKYFESVWSYVHVGLIVFGIVFVCLATQLPPSSLISFYFPTVLTICITSVASVWRVYRAGQTVALEFLFFVGFMVSMLASFMITGFDFSKSMIRFVLIFPALMFFISIGTRINELKNQSKLLIRDAELAQSAAEFRSNFLAAMSHEIRTPMNGVIGMAQVLGKTQLDKAQRQYLNIINISGKALMAVINDILDFSKLESGTATLQLRPVVLDELVDECIAIFSTYEIGRDVVFSVVVDPAAPASFDGDTARLKQVLINLLGNAFKFTTHGFIRFEVSVQKKDVGDYLRFAVIDSGLGIKQEDIDRLFTPFAQVDSTITRKVGGTGLGLSICKHLVDLMGGDISVVSEFGRGSTFAVALPLQAGATAQTMAEKFSRPCWQQKKVLMIGADNLFAPTAVNLRAWGLTVEMADQAAAAEYLAKDFALVFVDVTLLATISSLLESVRGLVLVGNSEDLAASDWPGAVPAQQLLQPIQFCDLCRTLEQVFDTPVAGSVKSSEPVFVGVRLWAAEDNPVNQLVIRGLLSTLSISCDVFENGEALLLHYQQVADANPVARPAAILMDCEMPLMDGFTATQKIRQYEQQRGLSPIPIIGLSAHALAEFRDKGLAKGMNAYLTKPVKLDELTAALADFIKREIATD
jgi:signal transduction histidine kinase/CheY-like chemotaxis protein